MPKVGGWFVESYELDVDEEKLASYPSICHRDAGRPWGGRLYLTDKRLIFVPNVIDRLRGGESLAIPLLQIADVTLAPIDEDSSTELLTVERDRGDILRFHVEDPSTVIDTVLDAVTDAAVNEAG